MKTETETIELKTSVRCVVFWLFFAPLIAGFLWYLAFSPAWKSSFDEVGILITKALAFLASIQALDAWTWWMPRWKISESGIEKTSVLPFDDSEFIPFAQVRKVDVVGGLWPWIAGYRHIKLDCLGDSSPEIKIYGIREWKEVEQMIRSRIGHRTFG